MRFPTKFVEPIFAQKFRKWKNEWEVRTGNKLNIADGLAYLKTPGHFLPSIEEREKMQTRLEEKKSSPQVSSKLREIDELVAGEGIPELTLGHSTDTVGTVAQLGSKASDQDELETKSVEWLIVKYKSSPDVWTFPFTHRVERETAFSALMRVCQDQIGIKPHLPSLAPIAFRQLNGISDADPNTRMFYYKGQKVLRSHEVIIPKNSEIMEHKWVTRDDLQKRITPASWMALQYAIPLD
jgi:hypothetical protein